MRTDRPRRLRAEALAAASVVLTLTAGGAVAVAGPARAHGADQPRVPVVSTDSGLVPRRDCRHRIRLPRGAVRRSSGGLRTAEVDPARQRKERSNDIRSDQSSRDGRVPH